MRVCAKILGIVSTIMHRIAVQPLTQNIHKAFAANIVPAILLQLLAMMIAVSYFTLDVLSPLFNALQSLKQANGAGFAIVSTALFGGVIPFAVRFLNGGYKSQPIGAFVFLTVTWGCMGFVVDLFYSQQAIWFGDTADISTIAKKVVVDQFVFSTFLTCPLLTLAYVWLDSGFDIKATRKTFNKRFVFLTIPTTVVTNWIIWLPAVAVIYSLPLPLQVPLFNIVLCFFALLIAVLKRELYEDGESVEQ